MKKVDLPFLLTKKGGGWKPDQKSRSVLEYLGFDVQETVGESRCSKIKKARWSWQNLNVAIKIINKHGHGAGDAAVLGRLAHREAEILQQTREHPFIIDLLASYEGPHAYYLVLELAPGGDLLNYVNKHGCLCEVESRTFFRQLLTAVQFLHGQGIVHRDLKLDNVLLGADGNIRLTDFGFATPHGPYFLTSACGSYVYAAPEILKGEEYNGFKADVWSLGVCLYAMLCGRLPFPTTLDVFLASVYKGAVLTQQVSDACVSVLLDMLDPDPNTRCYLQEIQPSPWLRDPSYGICSSVVSSPDSDTEQLKNKTRFPVAGEHGFACEQKTRESCKSRRVSQVLEAAARREAELERGAASGHQEGTGPTLQSLTCQFGSRLPPNQKCVHLIRLPEDEVMTSVVRERQCVSQQDLQHVRRSPAATVTRAIGRMRRKEVETEKETNFGKGIRWKAAMMGIKQERASRWARVCDMLTRTPRVPPGDEPAEAEEADSLL